MSFVDGMATNGFPYQARTFLWRIRNFHMSPHPPGESILSPPFSFEPAGFLNLRLRLYPRGESDDSSEFVSLYLVRDPDDHGPESVCVEFKLILCDGEWSPTEHVFESCSRFLKGSANGTPRLVPRGEHEMPRDLLVTCEYAVGDEEDETYNPWKADVRDLESLSSDFRRALEAGKHCDLQLKSSDGFLFSVHKAIVFSRFPDIIESLGSHEGENEEHVLNINESGLRSLLTFLYSGTLETSHTQTSDIPYEILHGINHAQLKTLLFPVPSAESVSTTVTVKQGSFIWTISGFETFSKETKWENVFCVDKSTAILVSLHHGKDYSEEDCAYFTIRAIPPEVSLYIKSHIRICGSRRSTQFLSHFLESGKSWSLPPFDKLEILNSVQGDTLKIILSFQISDGGFQTEIESCHTLEVKERQPKANFWGLQEDLKNLYTKSHMSDAIIRTGRSIHLFSHKCILSTRSLAFYMVLERNCKKKTMEIILKDLDSQAVKGLLSYMCCGEVVEKPQDVSSIVNLYVAANRFKIQLLEEKCMLCLKRELTVNTVYEMIAEISRYRCKPLRELVKNFVHTERVEILNYLKSEKAVHENLNMDIKNVILVPVEAVSDIITDMFFYLCCGKLHENQRDIDLAIKFYKYADKYKLPRMKNQYISFIKEATNVESIGKVIALCNKYKDGEISKFVRSFVYCNFDKIQKSKQWKELTCSREDMAEDLRTIASSSTTLTPDLVMHVVHYLYIGKLAEIKIDEIVPMAHLYFETCQHDMPRLRECFASLLGSLTTTENVGEMSVLSHMSGDEEILKAHITDFIRSRGEEIVKTVKWIMSIKRFCLNEDVKAIAVSPRELRSTVIMTMLTYMHSGLPEKNKKAWLCFKNYSLFFAAREPKMNQNFPDFVIHLYLKARKYQLHTIEQFCVSYLKKSMTTRNAGIRLVLAFQNNDEALKKCVVAYISSNMEAILNSHEWKTKVIERLGQDTFTRTLAKHGKHFKLDVLVTMLAYMYTKNLSEETHDLNHVMKLHDFAYTFELPKIKRDCNSFFERAIRAENLSKFLIHRDVHKDDRLENCVRDFVSRNVEGILKSGEWEVKVKKKFDVDGDLHRFALDAKTLGPCAIEALVSYVHLGTMDADKTRISAAIELYSFAGRHGSSVLAYLCAASFVKLIQLENVGELLIFADKHRDEVIECCVRDFVSSNMDEILSSDLWQNLTRGHLDPGHSSQSFASDAKRLGPEIVLNTLSSIYCGRLITRENSLETLLKLYAVYNAHGVRTPKDMCASRIIQCLVSRYR